MANSTRKHQHEHYFTSFELDAMVAVCCRLDAALEDLTRGEISRHLQIVYNLPHAGRSDPARVLAVLRLVRQALGTFSRFELAVHLHDAKFRASVLRELQGDVGASHIDDVKGIQGVIDAIVAITYGAGK
jgi:hypothetical protein